MYGTGSRTIQSFKRNDDTTGTEIISTDTVIFEHTNGLKSHFSSSLFCSRHYTFTLSDAQFNYFFFSKTLWWCEKGIIVRHYSRLYPPHTVLLASGATEVPSYFAPPPSAITVLVTRQAGDLVLRQISGMVGVLEAYYGKDNLIYSVFFKNFINFYFWRHFSNDNDVFIHDNSIKAAEGVTLYVCWTCARYWHSSW